jgi:hypothetical protein
MGTGGLHGRLIVRQASQRCTRTDMTPGLEYSTHRRDVLRPVLLVAEVAAGHVELQALDRRRLREGRRPGRARPWRPCGELQAEEEEHRRRGQQPTGVAARPMDRARQLLCLAGVPGMVSGAPLIARV